MNNTTNYRIFVEKLPRFRVEAESLRRELNTNLNLSLGEVRLLCVYDLFGFSEELLEKSRQDMETLPTVEYFANLLKLIRRYALPQEGEILFSQRDLDRLPSGFEQELAQALPAGGSLKVSREPRKIDGGFVLVYGGVEQNCSFAALFDAAKDRLQDKLHALLFAGGQA